MVLKSVDEFFGNMTDQIISRMVGGAPSGAAVPNQRKAAAAGALAGMGSAIGTRAVMNQIFNNKKSDGDKTNNSSGSAEINNVSEKA